MMASEWLNSRDLKGLRIQGAPFGGIFLLRSVVRRTAKNGRPFLSVEVGDRFGFFSFNVFEDGVGFGLLGSLAAGVVLELGGLVETYGERFCPRIQSLRVVPSDEVRERRADGNLYDGPKEAAALLREELLAQVNRIGHCKLQKTVLCALEEVGEMFWTGTAAISMHHAYRYGLLEHVVHVTRAGLALLPHYSFVDADLAIAGMVLHDIGKSWEYCGEGVYDRTRQGRLEGHVVLGYRIVRKAALASDLEEDLILQLEHIVLSHQGLQEYGAAVLPSSSEAVFVAMIDNLDARMAMVEKALDNTPPNDEFSEKNFWPGKCEGLYGRKVRVVQLLEGKSVAEEFLRQLQPRLAVIGRPPCIAFLQVGDNPSSQLYVNRKKTVAESLGMRSLAVQLPLDASEKEIFFPDSSLERRSGH